MMLKTIYLVLLVVSCAISVYGEDDCSNIDLTIRSTQFVFTDDDVSVEWEISGPTDCPLEYRLVVTDEEFGIVRDERLEVTSAKLEPMSPCITYQVDITAINKANTSLEGPKSTTTARFVPTVQQAPRLKSLDIGSTSANVTWDLEGKRNRCPLKALYLDGGNNFVISVPLENLPSPVESASVEIDSLRPDTMYYFQVSVENNAGVSPITQMGFQTLE